MANVIHVCPTCCVGFRKAEDLKAHVCVETSAPEMPPYLKLAALITALKPIRHGSRYDP